MRLILLLTIAFLNGVPAYEVTRAGVLPSKRQFSGSVFDGNDSVFLVGGVEVIDKEIVIARDLYKYNVKTEVISKFGSFPKGIKNGALVTDGIGGFYQFGGEFGSYLSEKAIYNFSKENPSPQRIGDLPRPMAYHSAACDGNGAIYILGESAVPVPDEILKYDTRSGEITLVGYQPEPRYVPTTTWVKDSIYVFGGFNTTFQLAERIYTFNPITRKVKVMEANISGGVIYASAVIVGADIYLVGGYNDNYGANDFKFLKFDTITETIVELEVTNIEKIIASPNAIYVPESKRIYIFGGGTDVFGELYEENYYIQL